VTVNGQPAKILSNEAGVADWSIQLTASAAEKITAHAVDQAGNVEQTKHEISSH
jgi:hypothetical protein